MRRLLRERRMREALLPELSEGQWMMLLNLVDQGSQLNVTTLQSCSYQPQSTAGRHIKELLERGLLERTRGRALVGDRRVVYYRPSVKAAQAILAYVRAIA